MASAVLQVTAPSVAYILLGGFIVVFSMTSLLVRERLYINEVVLGATFGILIGPYVGDIFDPRGWGDVSSQITVEVTRVVLAVGVFVIGVELPRAYVRDHAWGMLVIVVPTMAFGWVVTAGIIVGLFPNLSFLSALAISACLTPTDPIVCAAIVGGSFAEKHVPANLRHIIAAESAANDGLAYPFLSLTLYLVLESSVGAAVQKWFVIGCLYQVFLGTLLGAVMGLGFSHLMRFSHRKGFVDRQSYVAQYIALVLFVMGIASSLGMDDLLAAFAAGCAVAWDGNFKAQTEGDLFSAVIDLLLNCAAFIYIGAWLPFASYNMPELGIVPYRLILLFLCILILRRIPALLLLYPWVPEIRDWKEALFSGHFGPKLPKPQGVPESQKELLAATLQPIVSFIVLASIIIHGLSIPFFSVGRKIHSSTLSLPLKRDTTQWLSSAKILHAPGGAVHVDFTAPPRILADEKVDDAEFGEQVSHVIAFASITVEITKEEASV